ncbi:MAG: cbb3-type cytochrome c oxidase subunit I [Candidatus Hydrogenedentes bacterium]|nr:cbb3-type cytochrome c oxidase subunit I [Candidatus Hydrogenedentota bacterium]
MKPSTGNSGALGTISHFFFSTDHKVVAIQYVVSALIMLFVGFLFMLLMRWQLAYPFQSLPLIGGWFPEDHPTMPGGVITANFYNQLGAMHGTIMIFLAVVPLAVGGFGTYLVPLMLGATGLAFPRLSKLGYWCYLSGTLILLGSFFLPGGAANSGWTAYPPLSVIENAGQTTWLIGVAFVYFSSLVLSINILTTIVQLRCKGLGFMRLPFFVWSQLVTSVLLLLAFPPLVAAAVMQLMDRILGSSFFLPSGLVISGEALDVSGGGSALLWQHLFWFLAHPEVYVLLLPAFGVVAEVIAANTRKPLFGYKGMVYSSIFLGIMSMLVWAHHMFLTGMGITLSEFFQITTIIISLPAVIVATSLVVSLWGGSIRFSVPMLYALAFLPMFGIGGLTGLPLAMSATNIMLHDTYYVIGHFHYVVAPGILFALFAGIYHWYPKVTGRKMNDRLGRWHFWPTLICMNGIFSHQILQGFAGVSRRLYDCGKSYAHGMEAFGLNSGATWAAFGLLLVQAFFIVNFFYSLKCGEKVDRNPWKATSLEWAAPSPPLPEVNFETPPAAYRDAMTYSEPGAEKDYSPQWEPSS